MPRSISQRPLIKVFSLLLFILAILWAASFFPELVLTVIFSSLLAFVLRPLVRALEFQFGMRRVLAIAVVFIVIGGFLVTTALKIAPIVIAQVEVMYHRFQQFPFDQKLRELAESVSASVPMLNAREIAARINGLLSQLQSSLGDVFGNAVSYAAMLVIVPFITYFILAEGDAAMKKLIERVPNKYFEMTLNVMDKIRRDLISYLRGWILESIIVGVLTIVGLFILGIDYPILIGTLAGVANLVPYLGPVVGASLAGIISLMQFGGFQKLGAIIVMTLIIRVIDDTIIQPMCFAKSIDMHPVFVILILILGHELMGVGGMLIAIPIATILKVSATGTYWGLKNYRITG